MSDTESRVQKDGLGLTEEDIRNRDQEGPGLAGLFQAMSDGQIDADALAGSEDGQIINERMGVMALGEDSEEGKLFWRNYGKGLKKEVHGEGLEKWSTFVPLAAEKDPERRFPLIFLLHGAHNPIQLTESYGVVQVAAENECIVIAPENENWESIEEKIEYARTYFPVDWSRVYSIGYSFGGFMTSRNVLAHPEIFAGAGMGGMLFGTKVKAHVLDGQPYTAYELTEEMKEKAEKLEVPIALFMGEHEMLHLLPLEREPSKEIAEGVIPLYAKDKEEAFNNFRRVSGCEPAEFIEPGTSTDPVENAVGAKFEKTEVREYHGRKYYVGDSLNKDGECLFRTIACEGMVHWPSSMFAELVWEHLRHFARDPKTGKLERI